MHIPEFNLSQIGTVSRCYLRSNWLPSGEEESSWLYIIPGISCSCVYNSVSVTLKLHTKRGHNCFKFIAVLPKFGNYNIYAKSVPCVSRNAPSIISLNTIDNIQQFFQKQACPILK